MLEKMVRIRPVKQEDMDVLIRCAEADNHSAVAPTYLVEKEDQIIGCIGIMPSVAIWLDTMRTKPRDSLAVMNFFENSMRAQGAGIIALPCVTNSPFQPFLQRVGYVKTNALTYLKNLNV